MIQWCVKKYTITPCLNLQFLCIIPQWALIRFWLYIGEKKCTEAYRLKLDVNTWLGKWGFFSLYFSEGSKELILYFTYNILKTELWLVSPSGGFRMDSYTYLNEIVCRLYFIFAEYKWKIQSLLFKNNALTIIYAFILILFFKLSPREAKPWFQQCPCSKHFGKFLLIIVFWIFCKPD